MSAWPGNTGKNVDKNCLNLNAVYSYQPACVFVILVVTGIGVDQHIEGGVVEHIGWKF